MSRDVVRLVRSFACIAGVCLIMSTTGSGAGLRATGQITGTITDSVTAAPLAGITVEIYTSTGQLAGVTATTGAGTYAAGGLATGSYYARTRVSVTENHTDEIYDNVKCPPCDIGTLIPVTDGVTTSGIDFALDPGGTITGTVTVAGTGAPIDSMTVVVLNAVGATMKKVITNGAGAFVATGLQPGSYYARTSASTVQNYVDELFPELPCFPDCNAATGAPIGVSVGATAAGINFTLAAGATLTGIVTAAAGGLPLAGISVGVYTANGTFVSASNTNGSGAFTVIRLAGGTYYARTEFNGQNYEQELFNGLACVGCAVTTGTPIGVSAGGSTSGINFSLTSGGTITGTVTATAGGAGIPQIAVHAYAPNGAFVTRVHTTGGGAFTITGLSTGSYFLRTAVAGGQNFIDELYSNLPCFPDSSCAATAGNSVPVVVGGTTTAVNFSLDSGGAISGTVTDQATGAFISAITVRVYDAAGVFIKQATTLNDGSYVITGLPAGSYRVRTAVAPGQNYSDLLYNGIACTGACAVAGGTPIGVTVGAATSGIDFVMSASGTITGAVTASAGGAALADVILRAYAPSGALVATTTTNSSGTYALTGLAAGTYYVRTENAVGLIDELYNNVPCVGDCVVTSGSAITVNAGVPTPGVDFALSPGGRIAGPVTSASNGAAIAGIAVGIYTSSGAWVTNAITDAAGNYVTPTGLVTGTYYARTFSTTGYLNEIFDNQTLCVPNCVVTAGTAISVTTGVTTQPVGFVLTPGTELIQNGDFANGRANWSLFATPDLTYLQWQVPNNAFQFYRVPPPPSTSNSAVILQGTGAAVAAGAPLIAEFDLANTSSVRKRISVLLHDGDFSDLSVCTFWLAPDAPRRRYGMQTHGTEAWTNATISFYAASAGSNGGYYEIDNVSLQAPAGASIGRTSCLDPLTPATSGAATGPDLIANGGFGAGTTSWILFGQMTQQVNAGVFEVHRPTSAEPAGVILQPTGASGAAAAIVTAQFDLGNSSGVRKRVTVLLHDLDFSDLTACTFWLAPGQVLSTYTMRGFATKSWTNATLSVYAATVGTETWTRLDNVSMRLTPGSATTGTQCVAPGG